MQVSVDFKVPRAWHELNDKQLWFVFRLLAADINPIQAKTVALLHFAKCRVIKALPKGVFRLAMDGKEFNASATQIAEILPALDWINELPNFPVRPNQMLLCNALPADFDGVPFESFIIAENLYQGFLATKQDKLLDELTALLYPSLKRTAPLLRLQKKNRIAAFYWFASLKNYLAARFSDFFHPSDTGNGNLLGVQQENIGKQLQNSIDAQIRALTKGDVTKEALVLKLDTIRALTELNAQAREYRELNAKFPRK